MVREIACRNGFFYADDRALAFLRIYKGGANDSFFREIFEDSHVAFHGSSSLSYKNINLFMNFLENPKAVDIGGVNIACLDEMIEMVLSLVDIACSYTLNTGVVDKKLYRYEDNRNLEGYENGYLTSLKSTSSKARTIKSDFNGSNIVALSYRPYGFCPYLQVESILGDCEHANEDEYLFMPFIKCHLTDEYEVDNKNTDYFRVVQVKDDYADGDYDLEELFNAFSSSKDEFEAKFLEDKEKGIVSDDLCNLSSHVRNFLMGYSRNKYKFYSELYKNRYGDEFVSGDDSWGEEYVGFRDAIVTYFTNTDSNRSWYKNDTMHVLVFSELVESGFIPNNLLGGFYISNNPNVLENFLKGPRDDGFKSLTDVEYKEFISNFNTIFDMSETTQRRVDLCNQIICADYSDSKSVLK